MYVERQFHRPASSLFAPKPGTLREETCDAYIYSKHRDTFRFRDAKTRFAPKSLSRCVRPRFTRVKHNDSFVSNDGVNNRGGKNGARFIEDLIS